MPTLALPAQHQHTHKTAHARHSQPSDQAPTSYAFSSPMAASAFLSVMTPTVAAGQRQQRDVSMDMPAGMLCKDYRLYKVLQRL